MNARTRMAALGIAAFGAAACTLPPSHDFVWEHDEIRLPRGMAAEITLTGAPGLQAGPIRIVLEVNRARVIDAGQARGDLTRTTVLRGEGIYPVLFACTAADGRAKAQRCDLKYRIVEEGSVR